MKRLVDYDPFTKTETWHEYDDASRVTTIAEIQDVEDIIEFNKAVQNHDVGGGGGLTETDRKGIKRGWWKVASIPNSVQMQWLKLGVNIFREEDWPRVRKLLNNPEWKYLRTGTGKV